MNSNKFLQISKNHRAKSRAFTLIEMLVTISIITLLTTMVISYSRAGQSINNLRRATEQLMADLKRAQSLSMLSFGSTEAPVEGWGIEIDENGDKYYLISKSDTGVFNRESSISFRKGISIVNGELDNENSLGKTFFFIPPEPTVVYIEDIEHNPTDEKDIIDDQIIILKLSSPDVTKYEIVISSTGMIYKKLSSE